MGCKVEPRIPTGSPEFDTLLSKGIPPGEIHKFHGSEGTWSKSLLGLRRLLGLRKILVPVVYEIVGMNIVAMDGSLTYELGEHDRHHTITCLKCNMTLHSQSDVDNHYCGNCHAFHTGPGHSGK